MNDPKHLPASHTPGKSFIAETGLHTAPAEPIQKIPEDLSLEIRKLAHDLSNALEIIVQTSFLLSTTEMKEPASDWLRMLDNGVQKALEINLDLRSYIKRHTS